MPDDTTPNFLCTDEAQARAALAWLRTPGDWPASMLGAATAELEWSDDEDAFIAPAGPSGRILVALYREDSHTTALILLTREGDHPLDSETTVDIPAHVLRGEAA